MKKCNTCGHDCHCDKNDCPNCVNDVCTKCNCKTKQEEIK